MKKRRGRTIIGEEGRKGEGRQAGNCRRKQEGAIDKEGEGMEGRKEVEK